jgi:hypothetical protein
MHYDYNNLKLKLSTHSRHICLHSGHWPCPTHSHNNTFLMNLQTYHIHVPMSRNLGALSSWNPVGLLRPVMGQLNEPSEVRLIPGIPCGKITYLVICSILIIFIIRGLSDTWLYDEYSVPGCGPAPVGDLFSNFLRNVLPLPLRVWSRIPKGLLGSCRVLLYLQKIFYMYTSSCTESFLSTVMKKYIY